MTRAKIESPEMSEIEVRLFENDPSIVQIGESPFSVAARRGFGDSDRASLSDI